MIRQHVKNAPGVWQIEGVAGYSAVRVVWRTGWPVVEVAESRDAVGAWRWKPTDDPVLISSAIGACILAKMAQPDVETLSDDAWARAAAKKGPGALTGFDPNPAPGKAVCDGCNEEELEVPLDGRDPDLWIAAHGWSREVDATYCPACTAARAVPDDALVGGDDDGDEEAGY